MGLLGLVEEALAHGKTPFAYSAVEIEQCVAQLTDLRKFGHVGATSKRRQLIEQRTQLLAFGGMLAPALQQLFGVEQDVHPLGQEDADQLRVAHLALLALASAFCGVETLAVQLLDFFQQLGGTVDRTQRVGFQLFDAKREQNLGLAEQIAFGHVHLDQVGLELLGQLLQGRGDLGDRQNARHERAALECVQRALQIIGYRLGQLVLATREECAQGFQVGLGLITEDLQQLRIKHFFCTVGHIRRRNFLGADVDFFRFERLLYERLRLFRFSGLLAGNRQRLALCQRMGLGGQQVDVITLALGAGGILVNQCRHQRDDVVDDLEQRCISGHAAIKNPIQQILYRPGQLADDQGTNHAAAALERMERAAHFHQRITIFNVALPDRQVLTDGLQHFAGFFDEYLAQIFIDRLFIRRWWQQTRWNVASRRIDRLDRRSHDFRHGRLCVLLHCRWLHLHGGHLDLRQVQLGHLGLAPDGRACFQFELLERRVELRGKLAGRFFFGELLHRGQIEAQLENRFGGQRVGLVERGKCRVDVAKLGFTYAQIEVVGSAEIKVQLADGQLGHSGLRLNRLFMRLLVAEDFDVVQRIDQRSGLFQRRALLRLFTIQDRRARLERITKGFQALLGHIENDVTLGRMVFGETFQVVLDAGDSVGEGIQILPVRYGLTRQQLFLNVLVAGIQQGRGTRQRDHR